MAWVKKPYVTDDSNYLDRRDRQWSTYNRRKQNTCAHNTPLAIARQMYSSILDPRIVNNLPQVPLPPSKQWGGAQSTLNQPRVNRPRAWQPGSRIK